MQATSKLENATEDEQRARKESRWVGVHRGERLKFTETLISSAILSRTIFGIGIS